MSRVHSLRFDALEARELLSGAHAARAHAAGAHARPAAVGAPLVLDGTLIADNRAATTNTNMDGGYTTSVPVSGQLSGLGKVHGVWYESTDAYGDYVGPDTVTLHGSQGSLTIAFSNATPGPARKDGPTVFYEHAQRFDGGSGAYAGAAEKGSIDLNMDPKHTTVVSLTLNTQGA
jgi:hypothetical protein